MDGMKVCVGLSVGMFVVGSSVGEYIGTEVGSSDGVVDVKITVGFVLAKSDDDIDGGLLCTSEGRIVGVLLVVDSEIGRNVGAEAGRYSRCILHNTL